MPVAVFRRPNAARLLAPADREERDGANDQHTRDKEETIAPDLRALHLITKRSLGLGSLLPFFALCGHGEGETRTLAG